jgi:hypothetical protein
MASCGSSSSNGNKTEEQISNDILSLPEMQFPNAAIIIVSEPSDEEPYYTVQGGSNMETHFAASFWFHVYTKPQYEIKVYDVVTDEELTLDKWRNANKGISADDMLVYLKLYSLYSDNQQLLIDEQLWINGEDTETLIKYGFDPDNGYDYELYNETEEWITVNIQPETTFNIIQYSDEGYAEFHDVNWNQFKQYMSEGTNRPILATITVRDGNVLAVKEKYMP